MTKTVYIVGSKGIPAKYGGFETFVEKLTEFQQDKDIQYYIACMRENSAKSDITADVFESFLGAIFLDQGIEFAKDYISKIIFPYIDAKKVFFFDYKSVIKEYGDAQEVDIEYKIIDECGVPHNKTFIISILIDGKEMGVGKGKNKKEERRTRKIMEKNENGFIGKFN